jgi:hypothetical protein
MPTLVSELYLKLKIPILSALQFTIKQARYFRENIGIS